jgi:regulator of sigma D
MKVYFLASSVQKNELEKIYSRIIKHLDANSSEVYEKILSQHNPATDGASSHGVKEWYKEWTEYIKECDFAIAEVSKPSSAQIGFEIGMILSRGKPVAVLHKRDRDPVFINDLYCPKLIKSEYTEDNIEEVIDWCIDEVDAISNKRFTFYITPEIDMFLDKRSKAEKVSRSEMIRSLIDKEMDK